MVGHSDVSLSISYMEIYKEEVYDLLTDRESVSVVGQPLFGLW